jgi:hypothetical protein
MGFYSEDIDSTEDPTGPNPALIEACRSRCEREDLGDVCRSFLVYRYDDAYIANGGGCMINNEAFDEDNLVCGDDTIVFWAVYDRDGV